MNFTKTSHPLGVVVLVATLGLGLLAAGCQRDHNGNDGPSANSANSHKGPGDNNHGDNSLDNTVNDEDDLAIRIAHFIKTVNDDPDSLDAKNTPAVNGLIAIGKPAIPSVLTLIEASEDGDTRMRACAALEGIATNMYGYQSEQGWGDHWENWERWREGRDLWTSLGSLYWDDPQPRREAFITFWRQWIENKDDLDARMDYFITTIDDDPDELHSEMTPGVYGLIAIGKPAIPRLLDLMESEDEDTRMRAYTALEFITLRMHGFRWGQGWDGDHWENENRYREFLGRLGWFGWSDPKPKREASITLWRQWHEKIE